jgi:hypothetical protein
MLFQTFCLFAQTSSFVVRELLSFSGREADSQLVSAIIGCYRIVDKSGELRGATPDTFDNVHIASLAHRYRLDSGDLSFAINIYKLWCHLITTDRDNCPPRLLEELIRFDITDGVRKLDYHALLDGAIVYWDPMVNQLQFSIGDDEWYSESCEYLTKLNRNFATLDSLIEYAKGHDWPNWNRIKERYNDPWS